MITCRESCLVSGPQQPAMRAVIVGGFLVVVVVVVVVVGFSEGASLGCWLLDIVFGLRRMAGVGRSFVGGSNSSGIWRVRLGTYVEWSVGRNKEVDE